MNKNINLKQILTWISVLALLAMIVMTFLPNWECEVTERIDGERVTYTQVSSVSSFAWFPKDHEDLQELFEDNSGLKMIVNDEVTMPVLLMLFGIAAGAFALVKPKSIIGPAAASILGIYSTIGYLTSAFLRTGATWVANLSVSAVAAAIGVACLAVYLVVFIKEKLAKKAMA